MRQRLAVGIEQLAGEILRLGDDQRKRRTDHGEPHLVDHGDEAAPHDLEIDRIGFDAAHGVGKRHAGRHQRLRKRRDPDRQTQIEVLIDREGVARRHDRGRLTLFHDRRPGDLVAGHQRIAIVYGGLDEARAEPDLPGALAALRRHGRRRHLAERERRARSDHADPKADGLDGRRRVERGVTLDIDLRERRPNRGKRRLIENAGRQRHVDLVHLADEPHVGGALDQHVGRRDAGLAERCAAFRFGRGENMVHRRGVVSGHEAHRMRADMLEAQRCRQEAETRGRARCRRNDDLANAEDARDAGRVRGAGTAESHHGVATRILAALDQMNARRRRHTLGDDLVNAPRGLDGREPERLADAGHRLDGGAAVERHAAAEKKRRIVKPEHQVGVGDGRLGAAATVACGARVGTGRARADAEQPDLVDVGDRAAARPGLDHVDHRHPDRQAGAALEPMFAGGFHRRGDRDPAALDQAGLGGGAAHVERDHVVLAGKRPE